MAKLIKSEVTVFKDLYSLKDPSYVDIGYVLQRIQEEACAGTVEAVRNETDKTARNQIKKRLPCVLFSGTFSERLDSAIIKHSGFICLDFDGFDSYDALHQYRLVLEDDEYVYSIFDSPSGDGLKVLVRIPPEPENHRSYFNGLKEHFDSPNFDESCVNESRICYMSSDPDIYINEKSKVFKTKAKIKEVERREVTVRVDNNERIINGLLKWWTEKYGIIEGERNRNVYILSMALNEFGIPEIEAKGITMQFAHAGFDEEEIRSCVESAYRKTHLFNTKSFNDDKYQFEDYTPSSVEIDSKKVAINFHNIYESSFIDVTKKIEYPPVALSIGTHQMGNKTFPIPFGTYGNFSCIVGASKSKKTYLQKLIIASYIGGQTTNYASSIKSHRDRECFIIDIDTEQSTFHAQQAFKRVMKLVGEENYGFYKPFALRPYDAKQRLEFIEWLIYESDMKDNIGLIGIDGLADLVDDFNDLKESQKAIQKVMKWTDDKQFHLTTILHSNYGTAKAVGHIGSSMLKKAETVCSVLNEDDCVKATFTHTRGFPIDSFNYSVNQDGLPYIIGDSIDYKPVEHKRTDFIKEDNHNSLPFIDPSEAFDDDNPLNDVPF